MNTKALLSLIFISVATVRAQYSAVWADFNAGLGTSRTATAIHLGAFTVWPGHVVRSTDYTLQPGAPSQSLPAPAPDRPVLGISRVGTQVRVAWPSSVPGYVLEFTPDLVGDASWSVVGGTYETNATERFGLFPADEPRRFYRLNSAP